MMTRVSVWRAGAPSSASAGGAAHFLCTETGARVSAEAPSSASAGGAAHFLCTETGARVSAEAPSSASAGGAAHLLCIYRDWCRDNFI